MKVKFYASSNASNYGISQTLTIASLIHKWYYEFIQKGEREFNFKIRG